MAELGGEEVGEAIVADDFHRPSERLPGIRKGSFIYGDGRGYFYHSSWEKDGAR